VDPNHKIFGINEASFAENALDLFRKQAKENAVYREFLEAIKTNIAAVDTIYKIPFLPIRFFKTHTVKTGDFEPQQVFESSGTSGLERSLHHVKDLGLYEQSFLKAFSLFYGDPAGYCIIGLLPSYLERQNSSLVYMTEKLVKAHTDARSGFYLENFEKLNTVLAELEAEKKQTWLIGVSFALLDWAKSSPMELKHTTMVETGGMKGRKREMLREELHEKLKKSFGLPGIHSEYGMTELMSQAYSKGEGIFHCPPWMKILMREEEDPFSISGKGRGTINIIDLANIHSCAFIATDDAGQLYPDGSFKVLGRVDGSDLRGCSLMLV
jgi:hypothetical protein